MKKRSAAPVSRIPAKLTRRDVLRAAGAKFAYINIFEDPEIREGLKVYSNWPTFPQLYVNGELIGGCDIAIELYESGELQKILGEAAEPAAARLAERAHQRREHKHGRQRCDDPEPARHGYEMGRGGQKQRAADCSAALPSSPR